MSDFVSQYWSWFVASVTLVSIIACAVLLKLMSTRRPGPKNQVMTHSWDDDLVEYNNPMPSWWIGLFYITIVFGLGYLVVYPGLGSYAGMFGWTSNGEYVAEENQATAVYGPIFDKYVKQDLMVVAADSKARAMGERLFLTHCATCHGSDAGGGKGFPNLRDQDWLYGGDPQIIQTSIAAGRNGVMPAFGSILGGQGVSDVTYYVLSLSGFPANSFQMLNGKKIYANSCAACHGAEGKGNPAIGSPNLSDKIWLYGGSPDTVMETISKGRNNHMPAHKDIINEAKIHLLAAYVWGLSNSDSIKTSAAAK
ncbi:MAG: cytochrome-c oxidase, cbb3-type subunit III [Burkholderiales bacterium]